jgi:Winged helix-turn-helix domain (DUF2582)
MVMTEVLFGASVAFVGYVIYVLVDEQLAVNSAKPLYLTTEQAYEPVLVNTPKKVRAVKTRAKVSKISNVPEQVGLAAGNVYRFLNDKGVVSVAKLVRELKEDSKTIQRSIGWLAQEGKITLEMMNRVEMISLS